MVILSVHVLLDWLTDQITTTPNLPIIVSNLDVQTMIFFYSSKTLVRAGHAHLGYSQHQYGVKINYDPGRGWKIRGGVLDLWGLLHGLHIVWKYETEPNTAYIYNGNNLMILF